MATIVFPDVSSYEIDMDDLEETLKSGLREISSKYYAKMKSEIEVGTGASQQAFSYHFYDDGTSFKALLVERDPEGTSHHQHWFGAHFQEYGAPNRAKRSWLKDNERALKGEVRRLVSSTLQEVTGG